MPNSSSASTSEYIIRSDRIYVIDIVGLKLMLSVRSTIR